MGCTLREARVRQEWKNTWEEGVCNPAGKSSVDEAGHAAFHAISEKGV